MKRPYLWLCLAVAVVYAPVLFFDYTYLDDYTLLVQNSSSFTHLGNLFRVFSTDFVAPVTGGEYYRPLFGAALILTGIVAGQSPFLFHLSNVLAHLGIVLLLYRFFLNVSGSRQSAFLGSLIFAVHPLLVQTVAWIPAITDLLATLFILWYLVAFDRVLKNPGEKKHYWSAALAFVLALASKETAILLPVMSLLYVWLVSEKGGGYKILLRFVPLWAGVVGLWFVGRSIVLTKASEISFEKVFSSIYLSLAAVVQYLGKMVFPFDLSTYPVMADLRLTYGLLALVVIAFGLLWSRGKRYRIVGFGVVWFLAFLLLSLIRVRTLPYSEILEHRAYLPFIGFLILILEFDWFKADWRQSRLRSLSVWALLGSLAVINIAHAFSFRNGLRYWEQAVRSSPSSPFSHRQLGAMRHKAGDLPGAEAEYKKAISIDSEGTLAYNNLGLLYAGQGRIAEAELFYRFEIATNPTFDKAYMNLGNLYWEGKWEKNRQEEARRLWEKTIALNPRFFPAYRNLAIYYYQKDQYKEGVKILNDIVRQGGKVDPDILEAYRPYISNSK